MKMGNCIRVLGTGILLGILPMMVSAKTSVTGDRTALNFLSVYEITLVDSLPKGKTQDDKNKDSKKKPDADKDPKQDPKAVDIDKNKPNIKEVPKARPKLRPGVITDKIKRRPPIKVKHLRVLP